MPGTKYQLWRLTGLRADRKAALREAVMDAHRERYPTCFAGRDDDQGPTKAAMMQAMEKVVARFQRTPW